MANIKGTIDDDVIDWDEGVTNQGDVISAAAGHDIVYGYGGHDEIEGDHDTDYVFGGEGDDVL